MISIAIAVGCFAFLAWFVRRARLGRASRTVAGVRSPLARHAKNPTLVSIVARALLGALAGFFIGGPILGIVACIAGGASEPFLRARAARNRDRRVSEQLPDMMRAIAAAVRAGRSIPQALASARDESGEPLRVAIDACVARIHVGATLAEALDVFASVAGTEEAALVVETLTIGRAAGLNLPVILDVAVESLAERDRIARDRRATSAQAKLSAVVVGLMPLAFFAIVGPGARDQVHVLFGDPIGWALLTGGLILEAGGALWMRALLRPR